MSAGGRPLEWIPIVIVGGLILVVDLTIVTSELVSPTKPLAMKTESSASTTKHAKESGAVATTQVMPTLQRPSVRAPLISPPEGTEGRGVPRFMPSAAEPPSRAAAEPTRGAAEPPTRVPEAPRGPTDTPRGGTDRPPVDAPLAHSLVNRPQLTAAGRHLVDATDGGAAPSGEAGPESR